MVEPVTDAAAAGAAGLMLAAIGPDATEIEVDAVDRALMRLLMLTRPKAQALRKASVARPEEAAPAAAGLPPDEREQLIGRLWSLGGEGPALRAAAEAFGLSEERVAALRPAEGAA